MTEDPTMAHAKEIFLAAVHYIDNAGRRPQLEALIMKRFNRLQGQVSSLEAICTELHFVGTSHLLQVVERSLDDLVTDGKLVKTFTHSVGGGMFPRWVLATGKMSA